MRAAIVAIAVCALVAGCTGAMPSPSATQGAAPSPAAVAVETSSAAAVPPAASPSPSPSASPSPPPIPACPPLGTPGSAKPVALVLPTDSRAPAQLEITSPQGIRILIDVATPDDLSRPATKADVLLTTHRHPDHWNDDWGQSFPGTSYFGGAPFVRGDVKILAVPASHNGGTLADGTDTIFVVDVAGLRIVHFGDLGQDQLSPRQVAAIGTVDVAVSQLSNDYSDMSLANRKGFLQMAQVCPRLLIVTHTMEGQPVAELAASTWPTLYTDSRTLSIVKARLPTRVTALLVGGNAGYGPKLGVGVYAP